MSELYLPIKPQKKYSKSYDTKIFKQLLRAFGNNKVLPEGYELQALRALSHYPELLNVNIQFKFVQEKIAHSSRPNIKTLFRMYKERTFVVNISTDIREDLKPTLFKNLSYNAQIGVLSHELAHTSEYIRKSSFWIVLLGIRYACNPKAEETHKFENNTDMRAINHGAGYQLLQWSKEVHNHHVRDGRGDNYYSPKQIQLILKNHVLY